MLLLTPHLCFQMPEKEHVLPMVSQALCSMTRQNSTLVGARKTSTQKERQDRNMESQRQAGLSPATPRTSYLRLASWRTLSQPEEKCTKLSFLGRIQRQSHFTPRWWDPVLSHTFYETVLICMWRQLAWSERKFPGFAVFHPGQLRAGLGAQDMVPGCPVALLLVSLLEMVLALPSPS